MYYMYVVCYLCKTADIILYVSNTNFLRDNKVYLILSYQYMVYTNIYWKHSFDSTSLSEALNLSPHRLS